ncbi:hypothetical protein CAY99_34985 [Pseudomonas aeruginosa]|nr:hypothetical protein CAY99_34985 [Pseudomonas aeruginosa]
MGSEMWIRGRAKAYIGAERIDGFDPRPMARELLASGACRMALIHGEAEAPLASSSRAIGLALIHLRSLRRREGWHSQGVHVHLRK